MKLDNKRAIITGGSMGLGQAIAAAFVAQGSSVMICARDSSQLQVAQDALKRLAVSDQQGIHVITCDVSNEAQVGQLFDRAQEVMGGLDILINCAGVYGPKGAAEQLDTSEWRRAIEINLFGTFYTSQKAIAIFKRQRAGKIVNLSGGGRHSAAAFY